MKSSATSEFWKQYESLPDEVQRRADRAYLLWQINPQARGLYFKRWGSDSQYIQSVLAGATVTKRLFVFG